jgi:endonuclease YncB( thermonuclease family)
MGPVIPFRRRSSVPIAVAVAVAVLVFAAATVSLDWKGGAAIQHNDVKILRLEPRLTGLIEVIDGDTVRVKGAVYRLVGFDTPERGDKARCDDERRRAEVATTRLRTIVASGDARLMRVACSCRPGQEGTKNCNYGRLCGSLSIDGRDVGQILIGEGLAHTYVCSATRCPPRRQWCDGR